MSRAERLRKRRADIDRIAQERLRWENRHLGRFKRLYPTPARTAEMQPFLEAAKKAWEGVTAAPVKRDERDRERERKREKLRPGSGQVMLSRSPSSRSQSAHTGSTSIASPVAHVATTLNDLRASLSHQMMLDHPPLPAVTAADDDSVDPAAIQHSSALMASVALHPPYSVSHHIPSYHHHHHHQWPQTPSYPFAAQHRGYFLPPTHIMQERHGFTTTATMPFGLPLFALCPPAPPPSAVSSSNSIVDADECSLRAPAAPRMVSEQLSPAAGDVALVRGVGEKGSGKDSRASLRKTEGGRPASPGRMDRQTDSGDIA